MAIPDFEAIMLPLLKYIGDEKEHSTRETVEYISNLFRLTEQERRELLPSGQSHVINNRVGWAMTYMKKAGLIKSTKRAYFQITEEGKDTLKKDPAKIDRNFLKQFSAFIEFQSSKIENNESQEEDDNISRTPQELIEDGYQKMIDELAQEVISLTKKVSPSFFERLVIDLLLKMGYGGSLKDAGKAIGKSGDGGIDGIIKEDKLGLDFIYIQAKRWDSSIGSKDIRDFVGSLVGQKANKGVFITTSNFTKDAQNFVKTIPHRIILIDGEMLARLMIENDIGVSKVISYDIKKIDNDYFEE